MMKIKFATYRRRDGGIVLYVNRSNGKTVGISEDRPFAPYGRGTSEGDRNTITAAAAVIKRHGKPFTGDLEAHSEFKADLHPFILAASDTGTIGGQNMEQDGAFVILEGLIVPCGEWLEEQEKAAA